MKTNNVLLLTLAMSIALSATACNRKPATDATTPAATAPAAVEPAPMEPAPMPADHAPGMAMDMSFAEMDKNGDGGITTDELATSDMLHEHFTTADSDGDGKLSSAEVDKHRADMAAK